MPSTRHEELMKVYRKDRRLAKKATEDELKQALLSLPSEPSGAEVVKVHAFFREAVSRSRRPSPE